MAAVKQEIQKLEDKLETWASALKKTDSAAAQLIASEMSDYLSRAFEREFKGSVTEMMLKFDDRFRW